MTKRGALRILVVEDEILVAMMLEDLLIEMGHEVVGPAFRIHDALEFARQADLHFAILDVNLAGSQSFPVADILRERHIPFVFATGYGAEGFRDGYRDDVTLHKPYDFGDLERAIAAVLVSHC
ncbi:response regulator [Rhizobium hidalgonense]|uniref:response regulator n=1 Tax=Rhizobium hidalgonense TaxID=1538159 RepID=UPI0028721C47|nr:response regulator [Rhizobium hidalgonense]MDR9812137.1 response regulator [Rhizobium hidalgonense]